MDTHTRTPRWAFAVALALVLLVAAGLRLYRLPELPVGLHFDEAANGILAGEIARGVETPIFIPSYTGKEVLFFYWAGLWMKLLGVGPLALRLSAALAGLATVAATVWAVRELLHGRPDADWVALLTGAFLATSFWHLILSRYGFRAITQPLMQALTVGALWRGLRLSEERGKKQENEEWRGESGTRGGLGWLLLAGIFCGLTAYTYLAARAFPLPLGAALVALLVADRGRRRARLAQLAIFVAAAALVLAPLAAYWLTHPGSFMTRTEQVAAATWADAWEGILACLNMFFLRGDPYIRFNLPHRPLLDPITAALFLLGIAAAAKIQNPNLRPHASILHSPFSILSSLLSPPSSPLSPLSPPPSPPPLVPLSPCPPVSPSPLPTATRTFLLLARPTLLLPLDACRAQQLAAGQLRVRQLVAQQPQHGLGGLGAVHQDHDSVASGVGAEGVGR